MRLRQNRENLKSYFNVIIAFTFFKRKKCFLKCEILAHNALVGPTVTNNSLTASASEDHDK